eukprot:3828096-Pleurochrysis_carterae.AAC.1
MLREHARREGGGRLRARTHVACACAARVHHPCGGFMRKALRQWDGAHAHTRCGRAHVARARARCASMHDARGSE